MIHLNLNNKKAAKNYTIFDSFQKKKNINLYLSKEYVVAINQKIFFRLVQHCLL